MKKDSIFIYSNDFVTYQFNKDHPFNQIRTQIVYDLLSKLGYLQNNDIVPPRMASDEELLLIHSPDFIEAVKLAGEGKLDSQKALMYGLGTEDVPIFPHMHEAAALLVGSTLTAVDEVLEGRTTHALNLGGGLHHGFRGKASGFCIYNDSSVAIKYIQEKYGYKVLYVDTDAHHGDGVQWAFYDDPTVCTFSMHETGRYLFPGTGAVSERGTESGYGFSFNIPLDAFTEDKSFLSIYTTALREITHFFKPDIIITQNGADAHYYDPLTHLSSTIAIYREIPKLAHELAHTYCEGRWIALGGGGYDYYRVIPRAWAFIWLEMLGIQHISGSLPLEWLSTWQEKAPVELITTWEDPPNLYAPIPRKQEIEEKNNKMLQQALNIIPKKLRLTESI